MEGTRGRCRTRTARGREAGRLRAYLVEVGVPCHGVAALVGVAAARGFGLHGERTVCGGVEPERGARAV